jgi:hypothetical protein
MMPLYLNGPLRGSNAAHQPKKACDPPLIYPDPDHLTQSGSGEPWLGSRSVSIEEE